MEAEIEFADLSSWEDFDAIAKILSKELKYRLLRKVQGPDARAFTFSDKDFGFWLVHDDMAGNFLKTENSENLSFLEQIAVKINEAMKSA